MSQKTLWKIQAGTYTGNSNVTMHKEVTNDLFTLILILEALTLECGWHRVVINAHIPIGKKFSQSNTESIRIKCLVTRVY